jgi:hypothetical protein
MEGAEVSYIYQIRSYGSKGKRKKRSMSKSRGRDSSVGIATGYGLDGSGIESR